MGLRLKSQMAAFLFVLFGSTILLVTYFNTTLLSQTLELQAEQEALALAHQVATWLPEVIPDEGYTAARLREPETRSTLNRYLALVPRIRVLQLFDLEGRPIFRFREAPPATSLIPGALRRVIQEGRPLWRLWSIPPEGPSEGRPFTGVNPFYQGSVSLEYFRPLRTRMAGGMETGPVRAVMYLSLEAPLLVRRLQLILAGNAVLAILFLVTAFIAIYLWGEHAVNRPLTSLMQAQERLGRGDYTAKVELELPSANEMAVLTNSFNRMARELLQYQGALEEKTRRLEQVNHQYLELNEKLEQQVEEKTEELREFFSLLTHDLRIPLAAIQGYADLLARGEMTSRQARYVRGISSANSHLLELVRNLLDAVRFDAGQVQLIPEVFDLEGLFAEVISSTSPSAEGDPVRIRTELDLVDGRVFADRTRMGRVMTNLLGNALRYSPEGEPVVLRATERVGLVEIEVLDRGPGIPPESLPHLFQKFRRAPSREGPSSGLGLGLYIVRRILESHGRTISVESRPDEGTRFFFDLPLPPGPEPGPSGPGWQEGGWPARKSQLPGEPEPSAAPGPG